MEEFSGCLRGLQTVIFGIDRLRGIRQILGQVVSLQVFCPEVDLFHQPAGFEDIMTFRQPRQDAFFGHREEFIAHPVVFPVFHQGSLFFILHEDTGLDPVVVVRVGQLHFSVSLTVDSDTSIDQSPLDCNTVHQVFNQTSGVISGKP